MRVKVAVLAVAAAAIALTAAPAQAQFEFHGYWRSGVGGSSAGGSQVCFAAPGAWYKFRLGNECETYAEFEFAETVFKDKSGVQFDFHQMLAYQTIVAPVTFNPIAAGAWQLRQLWIEAKGIPGLGGASVWIGDRYYKRHDVHIIDFFYWDPSGSGFGIDNVDVGFAKFAGALFQTTNTAAGVTNTVAWRPDLRLYGINTNPDGALEVGLDMNMLRNGPQPNSLWLTVEHQQANIFGAGNRFSVAWAQGTAWNMSGSPDFGGTNQNKQLRVVENFGWVANPKFYGAFVFTFQRLWAAGGQGNLFGIGARPVWAFNDYFKLQLDVGLNSSKPDGGAAPATLWKATLAPTVVAGTGFYARPELRLFVTYANWDDTAKAAGVAGGTFGTANNGWTMGAQLEAWF